MKGHGQAEPAFRFRRLSYVGSVWQANLGLLTYGAGAAGWRGNA
jgi:hypothetical protein